ncbi:hypothetical protein CDO73_16420 [Saccharibacillus sp. O23]|uniref:S-layer homology domain-containing protein n=1 Tax=Saccharibacillus sp. O23 TaxID=2009338 RepID=UPI000B4DF807|nr:S-layer homology domain-containing protein [Saccharibacillus sp. O23]OWR28988.1 hypothetical protein CDO73_16420 [Saccharibacillus sp. O23]
MTLKMTRFFMAALLAGTAIVPASMQAASASAAQAGSSAEPKQPANSETNAIRKAVEQGLLSGDANGDLRAYAPLTRQELAIALAKALKLPLPQSASNFRDIPSARWSSGYIQAVAKAGLLGGDSKGNFRPNAGVTREELAVVLVRAIKADQTAGGRTVDIRDRASVGVWAAKAVETAVRLGFMETTNGKFNPKASVQRQEAASVLVRVFEHTDKTAAIQEISGDTITLDGVVYRIGDSLKGLLNTQNRQALQGVVLHYRSENRKIEQAASLEIVNNGTVLELGAANSVGTLRISGNSVTVGGQGAERIEVGADISDVTLNLSADRLQIESKGKLSINGKSKFRTAVIQDTALRLTTGQDIRIETLELPIGTKISQFFDLLPTQHQVFGVDIGLDDRTIDVLGINRHPQPASGTPPLTMRLAEGVKTFSLAGLFVDPDQDPLTYKIEPADPSVAKFDIEGTSLKITALKAGTTQVVLSAEDGKGGHSAWNYSFYVSDFDLRIPHSREVSDIPNSPPIAANWLVSVAAPLDEGVQTLDLSNAFYDQDALTYSAVSENPGIAVAEAKGERLTITPTGAGHVLIKVIANDGKAGGIGYFYVGVTVNAPFPS